MAVFVLRCRVCGEEIEEVAPIGSDPHRQHCRRAMVKVLGVGLYIGADALPNKRHGVRAVEQREARWQRDMPAYKAMRDSGLQPAGIDGCADLAERVSDQVDIDYKLTSRAKQQDKTKIKEVTEMFTGAPPVTKAK